jgi:hypothetical protein
MVLNLKIFQPKLIFLVLTKSMAVEINAGWSCTCINSDLTLKHEISLKKLLRDKHSSFLVTLINYNHKKFKILVPVSILEPFFSSMILHNAKLDGFELENFSA